MRTYGALNPIDGIPVVPDTIISKKLTVNTLEVFDVPAGAQLARVTFGSTDAGNVGFINWGSTKASVPTTAYPASTISTQGSSEFNIPIGVEPKLYQVSTGLTTGFSVIAPSSGFLCVEFWKIKGST